ncbi:MAG: DUF1501 domain-containing protein [Verrucomicrobiota bacterium]
MTTRSVWNDCEGNQRRDFLKFGTTAFLGLGLPDMLRLQAQAAEGPRAKSVIMIWLAGGPATIDMWDLKPNAPQSIRGEFSPISTSADGIQISEHLPQMAKEMKHATLVRSLHHTIPAHGPGTVYMYSGHKPTPAMTHPSLGSLTARLLSVPKGVPPYVAFDGKRNGAANAGYLGPAYNPFLVEGSAGKGELRVRGLTLPSGFSLDQLHQRSALLDAFDARFQQIEAAGGLGESLDQFQEQALDMLRSTATKDAFDLTQESNQLRDRYGRTNLGQGALAARRLIEAGVRFVSIGVGGWDTHGDNFKKLKGARLPELDQTLSTLLDDLHQRGLLDETLVYCAGEFGRTPKINGKGGRDHWAKSMSVLLAGGGLKAGTVFGSTDREGMAPEDDPCLPADLSATLLHLLGIDPRQQLATPSGRSVGLFREGRILHGMVA